MASVSSQEINMKKIRTKLAKSMDSKRYEHTLGVAYTAVSLAMRYGEDLEKAMLAGLLHDCAKCMDNEKKIKLCQTAKVEITEIEMINPFLLHAKAGAILAKKKYDVDDADVLSAIACHTTGKPNMSLLDKIVYIADYIEPGRTSAPNLSEVRSLAFVDIDMALLKILTDILDYLKKTGESLDPMTSLTYEYYVEKLQPNS